MSDVISQPPAPASLFGEDHDLADKPKRKTSAAKEAALAEHLPPNLGKPLKVATPDFSNPDRPKTCLEVDFPLVPINALSALEGNAGKPIYQMSKWWARRRSCVFRALLLAAAMEAPTKKDAKGNPLIGTDGKPLIDEDATAQAVWDAYYANHQTAEGIKKLKVFDPFMGGGTTLVEGSRLGYQVAGVDLNPVAWFIVKNELAGTDPTEVNEFFDQIEAEVKPQIQPFYVTDGVRGRKGTWFKAGVDGSKEKLPAEFDPAKLQHNQRRNYFYEGAEIIYTFWAMHAPCIKPSCGHRTPIFRSPVIATKKLGIKYLECTCKKCKTVFHAELGDARIAPDAEHVVLNNEPTYTLISGLFAKNILEYEKGKNEEVDARIKYLSDKLEHEPGFKCPRCGEFSGQYIRDILAKHRAASRHSHIKKKDFEILPKGVGKEPVYCTLLIDPEWLSGTPGTTTDGTELGGYIDAPIEATAAWYRERLKGLRLIEVRGNVGRTPLAGSEAALTPGNTAEEADDQEDEKSWVPPKITLADGREIETGDGTVPKRSCVTCRSCGQLADLLESVKAYTNRAQSHAQDATAQRSAPVMVYCLQCYDPARDAEGHPYGGRYFKAPTVADIERLIEAEREWRSRRDADLRDYWPRSALPFAFMTHQNNGGIPNWGFTHWYKFFNPRQLLSHAAVLGAIVHRGNLMPTFMVAEQALGAVQQHLRYSCMLAFYQQDFDKTIPHFSNNNYHPKVLCSEINPFAAMGAGRFRSCANLVIEGLEWAGAPWERLIDAGKNSDCVTTGDTVRPNIADVLQRSSTELPAEWTNYFDNVITDPPFGDNVFYGDLANYFYVWLRLALKDRYPEQYGPEFVPRAQEAVADRSRFPNVATDEEQAMSAANTAYQGLMTACWSESRRVMKDGGVMAFTFHHSADEPWISLLKSLFDAGFLLEATYPIRSDETKGEGSKPGTFGSQKIEYDIIHVCRKRLDESKPVSWPKMRQWVKGELARLRPLLESYRSRGLQDADVRVILRGKALEFFSRHYGKVLVSVPGGEDAVLSIRDALLGINQLLDESSGAPGDRPPSIVQPVVYQYLRLFGAKAAYGRDEVSKLLRGTAIQQRDFERTGSTTWIEEREKIVTRVPIYDRFQKMVKRSRRELKTELDQSHFLIGAAMPAQDGDTSVNIEKELERETFLIRPGVEALLDWYSKTPAGADEPGIPKAAATSLQLLRAAFEAKRARMKLEDPTLFDEWEASLATVA